MTQTDTETTKEAVKYIISAAIKKRSAKQRYNIGFNYATGYGFPQNDTEAVKWFRGAAEQGDTRAQAALRATAKNGNTEARAALKSLEQ